MSLATTCPACGTCFRVVQDQLKVSEGWVRCGHCQDVFNAMEGLFELEATPSRAAPLQAAPPGPLPTPPPMRDPPAAAGAATPAWPATDDHEADAAPPGAGAVVPTPTAADPEPERPSTEAAAPAGAARPAPDAEAILPAAPLALAADEPAGTSTVEAPEPTAPAATGTGAEPIEAAADGAVVAAIPAPVAAGITDAGAGATPDEASEPPEPLEAPAPAPLPEFVRLAQRRARWDNPWVRAWLAAAAVVSGLALIGQAAYHWRDRLAAGSDWARAVLAPACQTFGCTLQPPQVLDALVVDSTALNRPGDTGAYELAVTLRNRANHPVAAPFLELTLSDGQGSLLSRRVLTPQDFQADPGRSIAAQSDVTWTVRFSAANLRVAGYTVAAFYP